MKAEEFKGTLDVLKRAILDGTHRSHWEVFNDVWQRLDKHRLEMEAAGTKPVTDDLESLDEVNAHLASHDNTNFDHSGRLDAIKKRLGEIERKHQDLNRYYDTHMANCHVGYRR